MLCIFIADPNNFDNLFFFHFSFDDEASLFDDDYGQPTFFHRIPFTPSDKENKITQQLISIIQLTSIINNSSNNFLNQCTSNSRTKDQFNCNSSK